MRSFIRKIVPPLYWQSLAPVLLWVVLFWFSKVLSLSSFWLKTYWIGTRNGYSYSKMKGKYIDIIGLFTVGSEQIICFAFLSLSESCSEQDRNGKNRISVKLGEDELKHFPFYGGGGPSCSLYVWGVLRISLEDVWYSGKGWELERGRGDEGRSEGRKEKEKEHMGGYRGRYYRDCNRASRKKWWREYTSEQTNARWRTGKYSTSKWTKKPTTFQYFQRRRDRYQKKKRNWSFRWSVGKEKDQSLSPMSKDGQVHLPGMFGFFLLTSLRQDAQATGLLWWWEFLFFVCFFLSSLLGVVLEFVQSQTPFNHIDECVYVSSPLPFPFSFSFFNKKGLCPFPSMFLVDFPLWWKLQYVVLSDVSFFSFLFLLFVE